MPELLFNSPEEFVKDRVKNVDLVCVDLDECLFPFFTQTFTGAAMLAGALINPFQWKYLPQLLRGAAFIVPVTLKNFFVNNKLSNDCFMDKYEKVMQGVPINLIRRHTRYVHKFFCPYSLKFLKIFADKNIVIAILSLTIQPILEVLKEKIGFIDQCFGNDVEVNTEAQTFYKYGLNRMNCGRDKLEGFQQILKIYGAKTPLVIGHSEDELPLVEYAQKVRGLSIGINPEDKIFRKFDLVLKSLSWKPLLQLAA